MKDSSPHFQSGGKPYKSLVETMCSISWLRDNQLRDLIGLNSVWTGCASAFSNAHAPNELERVEDFFKGIEFAGTIMENFAQT